MDNPNAVRMAYIRSTLNRPKWNLGRKLAIADSPRVMKLIQPTPWLVLLKQKERKLPWCRKAPSGLESPGTDTNKVNYYTKKLRCAIASYN